MINAHRRPRAFEHSTKTLKIKQPDGTFTEESLEIRKSLQGPVVYDQDGLTVAMRVAGLDRPKMLEQWFRMGEATDLEGFKDALRLMSVPMWHANYADDKPEGRSHLKDEEDFIASAKAGTLPAVSFVKPGAISSTWPSPGMA